MATDARPQILFNTEELPVRDATLFKSFVRLIDHVMRHQWVYTSGPSCDLRVVTEDTSASFANDAGKASSAARVLTVTTRRSELPHHICLPLHTNELEFELNLLGALIVQARPATGTSIQISADTMKLRRWPPPALLGTLGRTRLATLMTANGVTLETASRLSGMDRESSMLFLEELNKAGLLQVVQVDAVPSHTPGGRASAVTDQRSLFSLIRSRLGLSRTSRP